MATRVTKPVAAKPDDISVSDIESAAQSNVLATEKATPGIWREIGGADTARNLVVGGMLRQIGAGFVMKAAVAIYDQGIRVINLNKPKEGEEQGHYKPLVVSALNCAALLTQSQRGREVYLEKNTDLNPDDLNLKHIVIGRVKAQISDVRKALAKLERMAEEDNSKRTVLGLKDWGIERLQEIADRIGKDSKPDIDASEAQTIIRDAKTAWRALVRKAS